MTEANQAHIIRSAASLALAGFLMYLLLTLFEPFFMPLITGGIIALMTQPIYRFYQKGIKSDMFCAAMTVLSLVLFILIPLSLIINMIVGEVGGVTRSIQSSNLSLDSLNSHLNLFLSRVGYKQIVDLRDYAIQVVNYIGSNSTSFLGNFLSGAFSLMLAMVSTVFCLINHEKIKHNAKRYSPLSKAQTDLLWQRAKDVIQATVSGNIILAFIQIATAILGYSIIGIGAPGLAGVLHGVATLIPGVGSSLIWVPIAVYQVLQGNYAMAIGVVIWSVIQLFAYDYTLGPILIEKKAELHPFLILLGVLGGLVKFGFIGFILGPTIVALGIVGLEIIYHSWEADL